jgi:hypothetical protein
LTCCLLAEQQPVTFVFGRLAFAQVAADFGKAQQRATAFFA